MSAPVLFVLQLFFVSSSEELCRFVITLMVREYSKTIPAMVTERSRVTVVVPLENVFLMVYAILSALNQIHTPTFEGAVQTQLGSQMPAQSFAWVFITNELYLFDDYHLTDLL